MLTMPSTRLRHCKLHRFAHPQPAIIKESGSRHGRGSVRPADRRAAAAGWRPRC
jgi:hypothetical protein